MHYGIFYCEEVKTEGHTNLVGKFNNQGELYTFIKNPHDICLLDDEKVFKRIEPLTNFLQNLFKDKTLFIKCQGGKFKNKFAVARLTSSGFIPNLTRFFTYEEMNAYFLGIMDAQNNKLNFLK